MRRCAGALWAVLRPLALILACGPGVAQQEAAPAAPAREATPAQGRALPEFPVSRPRAPVLTLDQERLFAESAFGRRVAAEFENASARLAAENREIEAELVAEERDLTELRAELDTDEFRARAEAFDDKAVGYRRQQDAKARALQSRDEAERAAFFRAVSPILSDLVVELGAVAILDDRAVLFAAPSIDVTERAITRIDAEIGAGEDISPQGPILPDGPSDAPAPPDEAPGESLLGGSVPAADEDARNGPE